MIDLNNISDEDRSRINAIYSSIYDNAVANGAGSKFQRMSDRYRQGHWERVIRKIGLFSKPIAGGVFVDFGCKFGHLTPVIVELGACSVISVDVDEEYLSDGQRFIGAQFGSRYVASDDCYLDIDPNSVDFLLANEVISHINPAYLDTFYLESARILRTGGEIVISDGNNFAHRDTRNNLVDWYDLWDRGYSKEFKDGNYEQKRFALLRRRLKDLRIPDERLRYFAANTAGLWGDRLIHTVRRAVEQGIFVERPNRPGVPPIHPVYGVAMERGFHPLQVEVSLRCLGINAKQILPGAFPRPIGDEYERGRSKNFVIRGVKLSEEADVLKSLALVDHQVAAERSHTFIEGVRRYLASSWRRLKRFRFLGVAPDPSAKC